MKTFLTILVLIQAIVLISIFVKNNTQATYMDSRELLNMANTVSPIITKIAEDLGEYENMQTKSPAIGGNLIYKREKIDPDEWGGMGCVGDYGNVYYIRIYEWEYDDDRLWYKPIKDVPIGCKSCIDEKDVLIPYWDKQLQNADLGTKYYP